MAATLGWLGATVVVGALAWALARSAAIADRDEADQVREASALRERRVGDPDRRAAARPWANASPGRRAEDALRWERADAERAAREAEARLAEVERQEIDGAA